MVQINPPSSSSVRPAIKVKADADDYRALTTKQRTELMALFGGTEPTLINEGTHIIGGTGEKKAVDGILYHVIRLDELIDILQALGRSFTITHRTDDPFGDLWALLLDEADKLNR